MTSQRCLKRNVSGNDAKDTVTDSLLTTYGNKNVELSVIKDVISMYQSDLPKKEKILEQEKLKLDELNNQVWSLRDSYCNQVWQFSLEHNFSVIFKHYPFITEMDYCKKQGSNCKDDLERSTELIDLINEIDAIKTEIWNLNREKNFKQDVESALTNFKKLQQISDDATELLRLISPPKPSYDAITSISMPIYDEMIPNHSNKIIRRRNDSGCKSLRNKKARGNQKESLRNKSRLKDNKLNAAANNKKVIETPRGYPQLNLGRSIIYSVKTEITNYDSASTELTNDEKLRSFTPKKRSDISVRFEQHRKQK